jgi:hypothetical protein
LFVFTPDYRHLTYLSTYYPHIAWEAFLPHGGCVPEKLIPYRERMINISFMGSYFCSRDYLKTIDENFPEQKEFFHMIIKNMLENMDISIEEALASAMNQFSLSMTPQKFAETLVPLKHVDRYLRGVVRENVIQSLLDAGLDVDIYGKDWDKFEGKHKEHMRLHAPCDYQDSLKIVANSKFSLNVMPWFKAGSHDRVFSAMGCGAIAVTDRNDYIDEIMQDGGMITYDIAHPETLSQKIKYEMEHEDEAEAMAEKGRELFLKKHTWANRAREIIQYIQEADVH